MRFINNRRRWRESGEDNKDNVDDQNKGTTKGTKTTTTTIPSTTSTNYTLESENLRYWEYRIRERRRKAKESGRGWMISFNADGNEDNNDNDKKTNYALLPTPCQGVRQPQRQ